MDNVRTAPGGVRTVSGRLLVGPVYLFYFRFIVFVYVCVTCVSFILFVVSCEQNAVGYAENCYFNRWTIERFEWHNVKTIIIASDRPSDSK